MLLWMVLAAAGAEPDFSWLAGCWQQQDGNAWAEECWTEPRGNMLLGTGRSGKGDTVSSYEFMRIARREDGSYMFWGAPGGAQPVPFKLVRRSEREVHFGNADHDYPQTIEYRMDGDTLVATTGWTDGAKPQTWRYRRK